MLVIFFSSTSIAVLLNKQLRNMFYTTHCRTGSGALNRVRQTPLIADDNATSRHLFWAAGGPHQIAG